MSALSAPIRRYTDLEGLVQVEAALLMQLRRDDGEKEKPAAKAVEKALDKAGFRLSHGSKWQKATAVTVINCSLALTGVTGTGGPARLEECNGRRFWRLSSLVEYGAFACRRTPTERGRIMQPPLLMDRGGAETEKSDSFGHPFVRQSIQFPQAPELLAEWWAELRRRLDRAEALVFLALPDPGFQSLAEEIHRFCQACRGQVVP